MGLLEVEKSIIQYDLFTDNVSENLHYPYYGPKQSIMENIVCDFWQR